MKNVFIFIFVVVALIQLAAPCVNIFRWEKVLKEGTAYKFKTAPVDPCDPLRGRYVILNFEAERETSCNKGEGEFNGAYNKNIYGLLAVDPEGFAYVKEISLKKPESGDYIMCKYHGLTWDKEKPKKYILRFNFKEYYMNENDAPRAEEAYRKANRAGADSKIVSYALVKVKNDISILEELYLGGMPIKEYMRTIPKN